MKSEKKWVIGFMILVLGMLLMLGSLTVILDPYFHFHGKLSFLEYPLNNERYQNDGIVKHFDYDALITGSSMTECFRPSVLDELFLVHSIKVPLSGGSYKEIADLLRTALRSNDRLKLVIRGLDYYRFFEDKDAVDYDPASYPDYLYDNLWYNDVKYIFNKEILFTGTYDVFGYTRSGKKTVSFDDYMNWDPYYTFGAEAVNSTYHPQEVETKGVSEPITEEDYARIRANITQNVTSIADEYPDTEFFYFFSPYSIYYFDYYHRSGVLDKYLKAEQYITELLLEHENIHIFSFFLQDGLIDNLDNYKDIAHYGIKVSDEILRWMKESTGEITKENFYEYARRECEFFENYDYDAFLKAHME